MTIDEEFQKLIPPLTDDEYRQLEENCIKEGIREAILVWDRGDDLVIVDGHNRYKIAREHNLKWNHKVMNFESREDAMLWMIDNQLGKRNLQKYDAVILNDKKRSILSELAKKNKGGDRKSEKFKESVPKKSWDLISKKEQRKASRENETDYKIAKSAGVSEDTVRKVRKIEAEATPQVKEAVRQGKLSINQAYNSTFPKVLDPVKEAKERHEAFQEKAKEDVVDFKDAMLDKYDQNIISHGFVRDLYRMGTAVKLFGLSHKKEEIEEQIAKLSEETIKNIIVNIQASIDELERTKKLLERRGK